MLLAVDVGNTNIVFGFFEKQRLVSSLRIATDHARTADESGLLLNQFMQFKKLSPFTSMVVATVVPKMEYVIRSLAADYYKLDPLFVQSTLKLNISFDYPRPNEIGADRICNAVAAYDRFGGPTIVVDFGTATTFDLISEKGAYLGGAIAPGIETSQSALAHRAAQLFKVAFEPPVSPIGKSTEEAMKSGFYLGAIGQTEYLIESILRSHQADAKVIATGGLATLIAPQSKYITEVLPDITLDGLRLIYELNAG